jgi:hypothetical protein
MITRQLPRLQMAIDSKRPLYASLFSVISFRHGDARSIFQQTERRLAKRDPNRFVGYAEQRLIPHAESASISEGVQHTARDPRWKDLQRLLYSVELEIWMDISRANEAAMALYEACLQASVPFHVIETGPFNPLFGELLLQKNGFEQATFNQLPEDAIEAGLTPVYIN